MTVYTETVVHAAGEPYQLAIVSLDDGRRLTARILGERVQIGDSVELAEERDGVSFFRKAAGRETRTTS